MPNFGLTPHYYNIGRNLKAICDKRIAATEIDFPLTYNDIQHMVLALETLELVNKLKTEHKFKTIQQFETVFLRLELGDAIPHLPLIKIDSKQGWFLKEEMSRWGGGNNTTTFHVDLSPLSEEKRLATVNWINNNVTEHRQRDLVEIITKSYFNTLYPTLWHIMSQWETLTLGFDRDLKERAREKPLRKARYRWDYDADTIAWYNNNKKYIEFIDQILLGAQVLPDIKQKRTYELASDEVIASVYKYTKRQGELV